MFERILNYAKFSEKLTFFTPLIRTRMFSYQGGRGEARNVSLSENFADFRILSNIYDEFLAYVLSE